MLITASLFLSSASAEYYGRFWRGEEKTNYPELAKYCDDTKNDCFVELINRWLIPATPSYAAKDSLMGYAPVLLPKRLNKKYQDEIALILYKSEASYRILRGDKTNKEGASYGPIHGDIFEMGEKNTMASSRSLVPKVYNGVSGFEGPLSEVSYEIKTNGFKVPGAKGSFSLIERGNLTEDQFIIKVGTYLSTVYRVLGSPNKIKSQFALYTLYNKDYLMQYSFHRDWSSKNLIKKALKANGLKVEWSTNLKPLKVKSTEPLLYTPIKRGTGGNLVFEPGVKPGQVEHYRLHL